MASEIIKADPYRGNSERGVLGIKSHKATFPNGSTDPIIFPIETANLGAGSVAITTDLTNSTVNYSANLEVSNDNINWTNIARKELDGNEIATGNTTLTAGSAYNHIVTYADYPLAMAMRFFRFTLTPASGPTPVGGDVIPVHVVLK